MEAFNLQLKDVERKQEEQGNTIAQMRGELDLLKSTARDTSRQTIWQFVIFTVTMAGILLGGIKYQADTLRYEMDLRFDAMEKRIEQSEKNVISRFEDLKQEVRANRK